MLKMFELVGHADTLLEGAWRERRWGTFIRVWLMTSVALLILSFVAPFVFFYLPALVYNLFAFIIGEKPLAVSISDIWYLAAPFAAMVAAVTLIFTVPVMLLKQLSGEFHSP
jgi:hypothetical protein